LKERSIMSSWGDQEEEPVIAGVEELSVQDTVVEEPAAEPMMAKTDINLTKSTKVC
jgi:hypothetical protein